MRYVTLAGVQLRASLQTALRHRVDAAFSAFASFVRVLISLVPLVALFEHRTSVAGVSREEAYIVVGWFMVLKGVVDATIQPSLVSTLDQMRRGALDGILLKPADSHFLVVSSVVDPWRASSAVAGIVVICGAFVRLGRAPSLWGTAQAGVLVVSGLVFLHSLWLAGGCIAFRAGRVEPVVVILAAVFDAARWPLGVFRGTLVYSFVLPLCAMTTFPSLAVLDRLAFYELLPVVGLAAVSVWSARILFRRTLARYVGAGG